MYECGTGDTYCNNTVHRVLKTLTPSRVVWRDADKLGVWSFQDLAEIISEIQARRVLKTASWLLRIIEYKKLDIGSQRRNKIKQQDVRT